METYTPSLPCCGYWSSVFEKFIGAAHDWCFVAVANQRVWFSLFSFGVKGCSLSKNTQVGYLAKTMGVQNR